MGRLWAANEVRAGRSSFQTNLQVEILIKSGRSQRVTRALAQVYSSERLRILAAKQFVERMRHIKPCDGNERRLDVRMAGGQ